MTGPIRDARLRIDLDTSDAEDRIDQLEEKLKEIQDDLDDTDDQGEEAEKANSRRSQNKTNQFNSHMKPGKFGLRTAAQNVTGGLAGLPVVGGVADAVSNYAPIATGLLSRFEKWYNDRADRAKAAEAANPGWRTRWGLTKPFQAPIKGNQDQTATEALHKIDKLVVEVDLKLKTLEAAKEAVISYLSAAALTGGHVDAAGLSKFARQEYDWAFVQARKDKDVRDKAMRILGEQAPNVLKDLWTSVQKGSFAP
jgi:hypothetical protein